MKSTNRALVAPLLVALVACTTPPKLSDGTPRLTSTTVHVTDLPQQIEPITTGGNVTEVQDMLTDRAAHTATLCPMAKS